MKLIYKKSQLKALFKLLSTDKHHETLMSAYYDHNEEKLIFSDGYVMAIVPVPVVRETDGRITKEKFEEWIKSKTGEISIVELCTLIEDTENPYPDWKSIRDSKENQPTKSFISSDIINSLHNVLDNQIVRLKIKGNSIHLEDIESEFTVIATGVVL